MRVITQIYRLRQSGNTRAFVRIDVRSFLRGYSLFKPMMNSDLSAAPFYKWRF